MIRLAALDMAGTTIDDGGAVYAALRRTVTEQTGADVGAEVMARWTGTDKRAALAGLLTELTGPVSDDELDRRYAEFHDQLLATYRTEPPVPLPGVAEAIERLRGTGVRVALQTGYDTELAGTILDGIGWRVGDHLDAVITSDQVPASRPAPYLIFRAMEATGIRDLAEVAAAGDTPNDLRAGTNARAAMVIGVLTGASDAVALGRHPHTHLLRSVSELPALLEDRS
jgi:phosphonatase-like hydrolase